MFDVTCEKYAAYGGLLLGRIIKCICMTAMLLSVVSGRHAAGSGHKNSLAPTFVNARHRLFLI